ncbi:hypothetical protein LIP_0261 [Limnochorda pilosa]|uniref:PIN domain-containing protein n=1 Tax=Limnochorda pilosa TaxID=1555112 RepID=A0A0K2SG86_LIMPI|nr:hypothetical protein LIP_0261 [Limnochorda pilosa]
MLFSASLGGESFDLLWELAETAKVRFVTSVYCHTEARENLQRKRSTRLGKLVERMRSVELTGSGDEHLEWARSLLPEKDAPVLAAAAAAGASVLITGDRTHFGHLMDRADLPVRVMTVRSFLLRGPGEQAPRAGPGPKAATSSGSPPGSAPLPAASDPGSEDPGQAPAPGAEAGRASRHP